MIYIEHTEKKMDRGKNSFREKKFRISLHSKWLLMEDCWKNVFVDAILPAKHSLKKTTSAASTMLVAQSGLINNCILCTFRTLCMKELYHSLGTYKGIPVDLPFLWWTLWPDLQEYPLTLCRGFDHLQIHTSCISLGNQKIYIVYINLLKIYKLLTHSV